ncbi:MAG: hypothetical protein JO116_01295 [Planctomycetaceae bacterium]|nr:hypothetical protein [Planctomycetaceae bacterium]
MGPEAAGDRTLVGADGERSGCLFTLGPLLRGQLWETTAVRELRDQALHLARRLAAVAAVAADRPEVHRYVA